MAKFFFINKTSSSTELSRSRKSEKTLLLSHVQSKRRHKASARRSKPSYISWTTSAEVEIEDDIVRYRGRPEKRPNVQSSSSFAWGMQELRLATQCMPRNNCTDPFDSTVAAEGLIEFLRIAELMRSTTANVYLAHASAPLSKRNSRAWTRHMRDERWLMEAAISSEMVMYAILLQGSYLLVWMNGQKIKRRSLEVYTGRCLEAVRLSLRETNNVASQEVLRAVLSLAITSFWDGLPQLWEKAPSISRKDGIQYLETCKTHLIAFDSLLKNIGGWSSVLPSIRDGVILADRYRSIYTMSKPIIDDLWYPDPHLPNIEFRDKMATDVILPHMAVAFADYSLCQEIKAIIPHIVYFARVAECVWSSEMVSAEIEEWLFLRLASFFHRLASLYFIGVKDNTVRMAIILFLLNANEYYGSQISATSMLSHLRSFVEMIEDGQLEDGLRFWILCTASMTTQSSSARDWFDLQLISMVEDVQHNGLSLQYFRARLLPTLYTTLKLDDHLKIMVDRLRAIQRPRDLCLTKRCRREKK